jgi:Flp pilus assembly protein TadG
MPLSRKCNESFTTRASLPSLATIGLLNCRERMRACEAKYNPSRTRRGVSSIEFALVAPVFFLVVFGLIENGRMLMLQHAVTNAAREGCRAAALASNIDASDVETIVRDHLKSTLGDTANDIAKVRLSIPATLTDVASETELTVSVEVDYADASWLPLEHLGANPVIKAEARRKRE